MLHPTHAFPKMARTERAGDRLAPGSWGPIAAGFLLYVVIVMAAHFSRSRDLLAYGALAMIAVSMLGNYQRLFTLRTGPPARWALLAMVPPVVGHLLHRGSSSDAVLKFVLIFVVFLHIYSWRLSPVNRSRWRWALLGGCLVMIAGSYLSANYFAGDGGTRLSGVFGNPNNLALVGIALSFFLNEDDPPLLQLLVHGIAVATLAMTNTVGAILGYAAGWAYRLRAALASQRVALGLVAVLAAAAVLLTHDLSQFRFVRQFAAIRESLTAIGANDVNYGALDEAYGTGASSGAWRLTLWLAVLQGYAEGTPFEWLMGRGIGASLAVFRINPHNDFLRLLFETGAVGLVAFLGLCLSAWRGMRPKDRYVVPMVLIFCMSDNNFDNFLFMAMFMFFLGSTQPPVRAAWLGHETTRSGPRLAQNAIDR